MTYEYKTVYSILEVNREAKSGWKLHSTLVDSLDNLWFFLERQVSPYTMTVKTT